MIAVRVSHMLKNRYINFLLVCSLGAAPIIGFISLRAYHDYSMYAWCRELDSLHISVEIEEPQQFTSIGGIQVSYLPAKVVHVSANGWPKARENAIFRGMKRFGPVEGVGVIQGGFDPTSMKGVFENCKLESLDLYLVPLEGLHDVPNYQLERLKSLTLYGCDADPTDFDEMARLTNLKELQFHGMSFPADNSWLSSLTRLESISLFGTKRVSEACQALRASKLSTFVASGTDIDNDDLKIVATLRQLEICRLGNNSLTDAGIAHLLGHPNLSILWIEDCAITDTSLNIASTLPALKEINLTGTAVSERGIEEFRNSRPDVDIILDRAGGRGP